MEMETLANVDALQEELEANDGKELDEHLMEDPHKLNTDEDPLSQNIININIVPVKLDVDPHEELMSINNRDVDMDIVKVEVYQQEETVSNNTIDINIEPAEAEEYSEDQSGTIPRAECEKIQSAYENHRHLEPSYPQHMNFNEIRTEKANDYPKTSEGHDQVPEEVHVEVHIENDSLDVEPEMHTVEQESSLQVNQNEFPYPCSFCPERMKTNWDFTVHMRSHRTSFDQEKIRCRKCSKRFLTLEEMEKHMIAKHRYVHAGKSTPTSKTVDETRFSNLSKSVIKHSVERPINKFKQIAPKTLDSQLPCLDSPEAAVPVALYKVPLNDGIPMSGKGPVGIYKCEICDWKCSESVALLGIHYAKEHQSRLPDKILKEMAAKEVTAEKKEKPSTYTYSHVQNERITRYCFVCGEDLVVKTSCSFLTHLRSHNISSIDSRGFQTWELGMAGPLGIVEDIVELLIYVLQSYLYNKDMYCWFCCEKISDIPELLQHFDQVHPEYRNNSDSTVRLPESKRSASSQGKHCLCLYCHFISTDIIELKAHLRYQHVMSQLNNMERALVCGTAYTVSESRISCDLCNKPIGTQSHLNMRAAIVGHMHLHHLDVKVKLKSPGVNVPQGSTKTQSTSRKQITKALDSIKSVSQNKKDNVLKNVSNRRKRSKIMLMCSCCSLIFFDINYLKKHVTENKSCLAFHLEAILSKNDKQNADKNSSMSLFSENVDVEEVAQTKTQQIVKFLQEMKYSIGPNKSEAPTPQTTAKSKLAKLHSAKTTSADKRSENQGLVDEGSHTVTTERDMEEDDIQTDGSHSSDSTRSSEEGEQEYVYVLGNMNESNPDMSQNGNGNGLDNARAESGVKRRGSERDSDSEDLQSPKRSKFTSNSKHLESHYSVSSEVECDKVLSAYETHRHLEPSHTHPTNCESVILHQGDASLPTSSKIREVQYAASINNEHVGPKQVLNGIATTDGLLKVPEYKAVIIPDDAKPNVCTVCDKRFSLPHHLREHMFIHSGKRPYVCHKCGKDFKNSGNYYLHKRKCKNDMTQAD